MSTVGALLIGGLLAAGTWFVGGSMLEVEPLLRSNYRGKRVPTAGGIFLVAPVVVVAAAGQVAAVSDVDSFGWFGLERTTVLAVSAFCLLGLLDDVAGEGQSGGFRTHVRSLARGRLTTGSLKMVVGAAAAVLVAVPLSTRDFGVPALLRDGAVLALAANLSNLLDRAPGRTIKFSSLAFVVAALVARRPDLFGPALGVGGALGLLVADLRERVMIGDTGSNPLGVLVGMAWLLAVPSPTGRWILLAALVALNAASERVSYSRVIDAVAPLRWFDRVGSLRT